MQDKGFHNLARRLTVERTEPLTTEPMKRYLQLKQAATRLMMAGDLQRYLHALRLMHILRMRTGAVA